MNALAEVTQLALRNLKLNSAVAAPLAFPLTDHLMPLMPLAATSTVALCLLPGSAVHYLFSGLLQRISAFLLASYHPIISFRTMFTKQSQ